MPRQFQTWREQMDLTVDWYLNCWLEASPAERMTMRYQPAFTGSDIPHFLTDTDGSIMAEVDKTGETFFVGWVRSLDDLEEMARIAKEMDRVLDTEQELWNAGDQDEEDF
ncbi:hypothetical protein [Nitrolancea hollandica]|nr:hypothetical protein [Nitrolancea hollandica]